MFLDGCSGPLLFTNDVVEVSTSLNVLKTFQSPGLDDVNIIDLKVLGQVYALLLDALFR